MYIPNKIFVCKDRTINDPNGRIKEEINSRPGSPRSRSHSPKGDDETDGNDDSEHNKRILKEIGNGNDGKLKQDLDEENDVNILKEKLRKLEDNSKCSKCMVSSNDL